MADQEDDSVHFWGDTPEQDYYRHHGVTGSSSFFTTPSSPHTLFTRRWLPLSRPPRAAVLMVHGYGNDISWTFQSTAIFLAGHGYACFAADLPSHGRSSGLPGFVPDVPAAAALCLEFFASVRIPGIPSFLFGESMGGAICLLIHFLDPTGFAGAVLVAPMCRISEKLRPAWPITEVLTQVARVFPRLAIVPTQDLVKKSVRVEEKRAVAERNPARYRGRPRLGTVMELLRVTEWLSTRLSEVRIPFLVVHGSEDAVTDPAVSVELHGCAESVDKEIMVYDGMMHSLLFGESDHNVALVRSHILSWFNQRSLNNDQLLS